MAGCSVDPARFGLDMVMPAFFTAMLVSLWQGPRRAIGWGSRGGAVAGDWLFGGFWYVVIGALAGSVVGGLTDD